MEKLKQVLAQEDTVLFIGSGISSWSGLPSWSGAIEELAKFVESSGAKADLIRAEAKSGDLLQAASYGFDKLTKHQIGDFIRAMCRYGVARPHEIHQKIVSLGTRCFVTTNYDNLLEEALRQWQPNLFFRPPITNRHLTETAEIVHARAIDFIFKPHGDAADSDSIILTREQYRQLLPQGERQSALESLKMLMASRPVVYLGFGLKDPDFIYVRDLLANTYKGGIRDHYAIMADVAEAECDYWRRNYGIHLVSYTTTQRSDGKKDHSALLALLDSLLTPAPVAPSLDANGAASNETCPPDLVLSLARHAARLARTSKITPEFPIRVHAEPADLRRNDHYYQPEKFDHYPVDKFLDDGPDRALLVGLPGAGKSYALQQAAARLANKLHDICLAEPFDETLVIIPIFVDLKLYRGNLAELVNQTLPPGLPFVELTQRFQSKIFLDSFNEMPREFWESGDYEADFSTFSEHFGRSSLIIGSRTSDGLGKLGLPVYCLDEIDHTVVSAELSRMGIDIVGRFDHEVRRLLQKPFYFQLVTSGAVSLPNEAHPRDLYHSFFMNLEGAFQKRFGKSFRIEEALSIAAYDAINHGREAFPLPDLLRALKTKIDTTGLSDLDVRDIANWLVSASALTPHIGGRIAFVHQSVTEYLAAKELASRYQETPQILKEKLTLKRWDQTLFLALSFLPPSQAQTFFSDVVNADLTLALNAVKYLEDGRDDIVSKLLSLIPEHIQDRRELEIQIQWIIHSTLPLSKVHEPQLRTLMKLRGMIGGGAAKGLVAIKGPMIKNEFLRELIDARSDYNYCANGIASAIQPFAVPEDIKTIVELADSISDEVTLDSDDEAAHGFIAGAAEFLSELEISVIKEEFFSRQSSGAVSEVRARILCDILRNHHSTKALDFAGELLLQGVKKAASTIYFISHFAEPKDELSWSSFNKDHVDRLIASAEGPEKNSWSLESLQCLCSGRPDLAELVISRAATKSGIMKASLLYCAKAAETAPILDALRELVNMSPSQRMHEPTHLLEAIDINWVGNEPLLVQILKLRETDIALKILSPIYNHSRMSGSLLGQLEIGPIEWWLDWLVDESNPTNRFWLSDRLSWLFAEHVSKNIRHSFVIEFNKPSSKYREVLSDSILPRHIDLTTDDFSENAISFLLADLDQKKIGGSWRGHLLSQTATEKFVADRLLPLAAEAKDLLLTNLQSVLKRAGERHGRRYIVE